MTPEADCVPLASEIKSSQGDCRKGAFLLQGEAFQAQLCLVHGRGNRVQESSSRNMGAFHHLPSMEIMEWGRTDDPARIECIF